MAHSYRNLVAWQKALDLVAAVYEVSRVFPKEEIYGLTSQIRRAAVSVVSNIAEGKGLGYLSENDTDRIVKNTEEGGRVINGLMSALKRSSQSDLRAESCELTNGLQSPPHPSRENARGDRDAR